MAEALSLLSDSSDADSDDEFTINKNYAERYSVWRQKEEMQKLKDLKKNLSDSSSESEEEDIPMIEKDFLKTLSLLKSKDPTIYNENMEFFKEDNIEKKPKVKKEKPMFMKDYERKLVLERNGEFSDNDEFIPAKGPTFKEEEEEIKKSFKAALEDSDDETTDQNDLFQVRSKSKSEQDEEEADYLQWLKGQKKDLEEDTKKEMSFLKKFWNDPKLDRDEKFLRDYILNRKFMVKDTSGEIPTYDEITDDIGMLSEDEKVIEQQELFEHKYNFRFEEPDSEFIKRYPRTIGDSLRREDNKRKKKREDYTERKKREKEQMREELKRLKALKRKEIEEKFLKLKEVSGQEELNFNEEDIESDFDPDKHDKKMKELFNDDYYTVEEQQKPEFEYDEDLDDEKWDHWTRERSKNNTNQTDNVEEEDSSDDEIQTNDDPKLQFEQEMIESTQGRKKGKKKSLFAKIISQPKPIYDPDGKSFDDYLDEYYKLDYEDVIGDLPVRFRYRNVIPNDFGLSVDEILAANDKELNHWCSVKKTCQYRREDEERYDVQAFQKKAQNVIVKQKILSSIFAEPKEDEEKQGDDSKSDSNKTKRKKKRSKKKKSTPICESSVANSMPGELEELNSEMAMLPSKNTTECTELVDNSKNLSKRKRKKNKNFPNCSSEKTDASLSLHVVDTYENENMLKRMESSINMVKTEISKELLSKKSKKKKKKKNNSKTDNSSVEESKLNSFDPTNDDLLQNESISERDISNLSLGGSKNVPINSETGSKNFSKTVNKVKKIKRSLDNSMEGNDYVMHVKKMKKDIKYEDNSSVDAFDKTSANESIKISSPIKEVTKNISPSKQKGKKKKKPKNNQDPFHKKTLHQNYFKVKNFGADTKLQKKDPDAEKCAILDSRLAAFGINPKKFKNKIIYSKNK